MKVIKMEILERNINSKARRETDGTIIVKSSILDLHHNMFFEMKIELDTKTITFVKAEMVKVPYLQCKSALANINEIVGLRLERGLVKKMAQILGKNTGCTHMLEIAITASRTASYTILNILSEGEKWKELMASDEERYSAVKAMLDNSCIMFKR